MTSNISSINNLGKLYNSELLADNALDSSITDDTALQSSITQDEQSERQSQSYAQMIKDFDEPSDDLVDQELIYTAAEKMHSKNKTNLQSSLVEIEEPESDEEIGQEKLFTEKLKNSLEVSADYKDLRDLSEKDESKERLAQTKEEKKSTKEDLTIESFLLFKQGHLTKNQFEDIKANGFLAESYKTSGFIKSKPSNNLALVQGTDKKVIRSTQDKQFNAYVDFSSGHMTESEYKAQAKLAAFNTSFMNSAFSPITIQASNLYA